MIVVTGGGRGIGYEAASALLWLGARVIIAEIDERRGDESSEALRRVFGEGRVAFVKTDIGSEIDVEHLARKCLSTFGKVDAILNNATAERIGAVKDTPIESWDTGYRVDLRGPVLLAREFLPEMVRRKHGAFVCVSSSGAAPFMGPYEVFKTAQVELANTIAAEVEGTGVFAFAIGPGIVRTPGFLEAGSKVAQFMGLDVDQLIEMNKAALLTAEEAGVGFAASIALASKYHGSETSSMQVLRDIGIGPREEAKAGSSRLSSEKSAVLLKLVLKTYEEQLRGWKERNVFQRQWVFRDFKKLTGMSVDEMLDAIKQLEISFEKGTLISGTSTQAGPLEKLAAYYQHQQNLLRGFEKDPKKLEEGLKSIQAWIDEVEGLLSSLK